MSSLEIYKASAGSGKTFRIVREYLKMVFKRPGAYKNILAVTFTNKATGEMKDRILKDLSALASGNPSGHLEFLKAEFGQSEDEIRFKAAKILKLILHDYSRFSISTIDSFFQRVIRAFSREMGLNASYRTELDYGKVLEEAVDRLFLDMDNNTGLKNWMLEYAEKNLREGRNWNFREELIRRGSEIFNEEFKLFSGPLLQKLSDKNYLIRYNQELQLLSDNYERELKNFGKKGLELIAEQGLNIEDFKYGKSSFATHFNKLAGGFSDIPGSRTLDACNNIDAWSKATDNSELKDRIAAVYHAGLNNLLVSSIEFIKREGVFANSAKAILTHLFSFGLFTDIALKVHEVSTEKNLVLLNDSTQLLRKVISGSDSPFVYEKVGSVYHNFLLDEFQDTSRLQWQNFKPLIENSLAEGDRSIIVGDVKQSIYRWRNGDWNLLTSQVENDLGAIGTRVVSLDINWRSSKSVIDFNNILFRDSARQLNDDFESSLAGSGQTFDGLNGMKGIIKQVYSDHYQKYAGKIPTEGYVRVQFIKNEESRKKSDFRQLALAEMITLLETVQENGVRPGDIAILVRDKSDGALIANALLERKINNTDSPYCYDVISNDSLIIGQSPVVQFILNFFTLFACSENNIVIADLIYCYFNYLAPLIEGSEAPSAEQFHSSFAVNQLIPGLFKSWLPVAGNDSFDSSLLSLPLFELACRIAQDFGLQNIKVELVYLESFLDQVLQYGRDEAGGTSGFLEWWKTSGYKKTIILSGNQNAISILTIHKSKGLEFHTVFVPFCDWEIVPKANKEPYLWCHPEKAPFNLMDLVLVRYGSVLERTLFSEAYFKEMLYSSVDNLNLLYVAFTRAVNSLFVFCPYTTKINTPFRSISSLIQSVMENPALTDHFDNLEYIDLTKYYDFENKVFELGEMRKVLRTAQSHLYESKEPDRLILEMRSDRIKLRIHSDNYLDLYDTSKAEKIGHGKLLHELFERISSVADISSSCKRMVSEGKIDTKTSEEYQKLIVRILAGDPFRSWFSGHWRVLNERDILRGDDKRHRPDRVMIKNDELVVIDYKTGVKSGKDFNQVQGYLTDFRRMGYVSCKGYLWYMANNELVEVV